MTVEVHTTATLPDDLLQAWLQHMRDFDVAHPGCHFQVLAQAPEISLDVAIEMLNVTPALPVQQIFRKRR